MKTRRSLSRTIIQKYLSKAMLISFCMLISIDLQSQGSWNIGFIPVDSITETHVSNEVKIDFISNKYLKNEYRSLRFYTGVPDTLQIQTQHGNFDIIERRKIGVDYGYWQDQHFLLKEIGTGKTFDIWESEILAIKGSLIYFKLKVRDNSNTRQKFLWIDRKYINGLFVVR